MPSKRKSNLTTSSGSKSKKDAKIEITRTNNNISYGIWASTNGVISDKYHHNNNNISPVVSPIQSPNVSSLSPPAVLTAPPMVPLTIPFRVGSVAVPKGSWLLSQQLGTTNDHKSGEKYNGKQKVGNVGADVGGGTTVDLFHNKEQQDGGRKAKTHRFYVYICPNIDPLANHYNDNSSNDNVDSTTHNSKSNLNNNEGDALAALFYAVVDKVEFVLNPTFPNRRRVVRQPPFIIEDEAWGENYVDIIVYLKRPTSELPASVNKKTDEPQSPHGVSSNGTDESIHQHQSLERHLYILAQPPNSALPLETSKMSRSILKSLHLEHDTTTSSLKDKLQFTVQSIGSNNASKKNKKNGASVDTDVGKVKRNSNLKRVRDDDGEDISIGETSQSAEGKATPTISHILTTSEKGGNQEEALASCIVIRHLVRLYQPVANADTTPALSSLRFAPSFSSVPLIPGTLGGLKGTGGTRQLSGGSGVLGALCEAAARYIETSSDEVGGRDTIRNTITPIPTDHSQEGNITLQSRSQQLEDEINLYHNHLVSVVEEGDPIKKRDAEILASILRTRASNPNNVSVMNALHLHYDELDKNLVFKLSEEEVACGVSGGAVLAERSDAMNIYCCAINPAKMMTVDKFHGIHSELNKSTKSNYTKENCDSNHNHNNNIKKASSPVEKKYLKKSSASSELLKWASEVFESYRTTNDTQTTTPPSTQPNHFSFPSMLLSPLPDFVQHIIRVAKETHEDNFITANQDKILLPGNALPLIADVPKEKDVLIDTSITSGAASVYPQGSEVKATFKTNDNKERCLNNNLSPSLETSTATASGSINGIDEPSWGFPSATGPPKKGGHLPQPHKSKSETIISDKEKTEMEWNEAEEKQQQSICKSSTLLPPTTKSISCPSAAYLALAACKVMAEEADLIQQYQRVNTAINQLWLPAVRDQVAEIRRRCDEEIS